MDDEVDPIGVGNADLERSSRAVGADEHHEVIDGEGSDRVAVGVKHVVGR